MQGTVTKIQAVLCEVNAGGRTYECKVRGRLVGSDTGESKPLAVGDGVVFAPTEEGEGIIGEVLPRRTKLSRRSPRDPRIEHVIVANVDQILIVASVRRPSLTPGIIDRYVIAGEAGGIEPVVCINKTDLAKDESDYLDAAELYREMGYEVLLTSATKRTGLGALINVLRNKSTVLAGHSGVGKSALINAIQPGLRLKTGPVMAKGRHTTSSVSLLALDFGGYVVDTPGIREFTLWEIEKRDVAQFFPRIWELSADCRMPDCLHMHEPGCAVKEAVETGELPPAHYGRYVRIVETTEEQRVPRETDVEEPTQQIAKARRSPSRRKRRQDLRRIAGRDLEDTEDVEPE